MAVHTVNFTVLHDVYVSWYTFMYTTEPRGSTKVTFVKKFLLKDFIKSPTFQIHKVKIIRHEHNWAPHTGARVWQAYKAVYNYIWHVNWPECQRLEGRSIHTKFDLQTGCCRQYRKLLFRCFSVTDGALKQCKGLGWNRNFLVETHYPSFRKNLSTKKHSSMWQS